MFLINPYILSSSALDADAQAFITTASITDPTQQSAINQLVLDLKGYSIWSKMKAIYPFVGGNSTSHSYNLINTSNYQLTFNGGWTHSSTGALPNGTNAYANTGFAANNLLSTSGHISIYLRTNINGQFCDIGVDNSTGCTSIWSRMSTDLFISQINNTLSNYLSVANTDSRGLFTTNRTANNVLNSWKNGIKLGTGTNASSTPPSKIILIGALNDTSLPINPRYYSSRENAFTSIGDGLTDAEVSNFNTAVQTFQTTLSRQV